MLVVHAHAVDIIQRYGLNAKQIKWGYLENFGAIGVDIFFVISGFIIAYITKDMSSKEDAMHFIKKRFARIYPLYLCITIILILPSLPKIEVLIKNFILIPFFDTPNSFILPTISVAWSLSFELFFYCVILISILVAKKKHLLFTALFLILISTVGSILKLKETHVQFLFNPIFLEFVLGMIVCEINFIVAEKKVVIAFFLIALATSFYTLLICFGYKNVSELPISIFGNKGLLRVVLWGIPSTILVAGFVFLEENKKYRIFENKFLNLIGNASYSIYLTHILSFTIFIKLCSRKIETVNGDLLIFLLMCFAATGGVLIYLFLEKPLLIFFNETLRKKKQKTGFSN